MATENVAPNQFDDVPLSQMKQSAFEVPEEADASVAPDAEASLPLNDRLKTSKPGIRKQAYCELGSLLEASTGEASLFEEYAPMLVGDKKTPGLLHDKASLCHDGALSVVLAFAHHGPKETVTQRASVIVDAVVDKHLSQARLETKALDVLLALVDAGAAAQVQDSLVKGAAHKVPKTCAAAAKALGTLLRARAGSLDTRALASDKNIKALVEHRDKVVRGEGTALAELLMGGGGSLKDLKKFTALEPPKGAAGPADAEPFLTPVPAPTPILPVEAFDLLGKLPRTKGSLSADKWVKSLGEKEWKTRVAAAETVLTLAGGKELLASGDYTEVTKGLKGLLADSNVKVVATAINALGALARGLGRQYAQYAKKVAGTILEKGADKDRNVLSAVSSTLRTFSIGALLPAEMLECAGTALASPNPKVKVAALQWTIAAATATSAEPGLMRKAAAAFQDAVAPLTDDGSSDVRSAAFAALAGVHSAIGGDASAQHLDRLAPKKSQRVRELLGSPPQAPETANDGSARPRPVPPPPPRPRPVGLSAANKGGQTAARPDRSRKREWEEPSLPKTEELAEAAEVEGVPSTEDVAALKDWNQRKDRVEEISSLAKGLSTERAGRPVLAEVLCWRLAAVADKEKNVQVQIKLLVALQAICDGFDIVGRRSAARLLPLAVELLGVRQSVAAAAEALFAVGEACAPSWVMQQVRELVVLQKSPKVHRLESNRTPQRGLLLPPIHSCVAASPGSSRS